jgi:outer membrane protein assembly factor BamC
VLALAAALAGCSTISNFFNGDKTDYRNTASKQQPLEVPPDLTQLARDSRYQPQGGVISASAAGSPAAVGGVASAVPGAQAVAVNALGGMRIERAGQQRWLAVPLPPEQVWPQIKAFWDQRGFKLVEENAAAGTMETDWLENRTKQPDDLIRNTLGKLIGNLYDSGERDRFRTRIERTPTGSEIYVVHRGLQEVYFGDRKENTEWRPRPNDPQLEAEMLARMMVMLGGTPVQPATATAAAPAASAAAATAPDAPSRARVEAGSAPTTMVVDEPFDRAWRRVGLALDRGGFTVEDRDRAAGLYYVRYVDPKNAGKDEPGWWSRLFGDGNNPQAALRYRIALKPSGDKTSVAVQNATGAADTGENARNIASLLLNELR